MGRGVLFTGMLLALELAAAPEMREIVITGAREIREPIVLQSNTRLVLDNAHLTVAKGVMTNVLRADRVENVEVVGRGEAIVDGGEYNGLSELNFAVDDVPHVSRNNLLLFSNVKGFRVEGVKFVRQGWWALNFVGCSKGVIRNLETLSHHASRRPDGTVIDTVSRDHYSWIIAKTLDFIDLRAGCHDILVENVSGFNEDDSVAMTCLEDSINELYLDPATPREIYNITVRNVRTSAMCSMVRLLCQGRTTKLHDILVDGVYDQSGDCPYMTGRGGCGVLIGDTREYSDGQPTPDRLYNVTVRNVRSRANCALCLHADVGNLKFENVEGFDGCPHPVFWGRAAQTPPPAHDDIDCAFAVDFGQSVGRIKRLNGLCNGPQFSDSPPGTEGYQTDLLKELEPAGMRFHDAVLENPGMALVDISRIFPLFHADASDPRNYRFEETDDYLAECRKVTTNLEYRLGETIEGSARYYRAKPPADFAKWAEICCNVIRHYNRGWANGHRWNIDRWTIWEEPDNTNGLFATENANRDYFELYRVTAKRIRSEFPEVKVGGPECMHLYSGMIDPFIRTVAKEKLPLDYLIMNNYTGDPESAYAVAMKAQDKLRANRLRHVPLVFGEWHSGPLGTWRVFRQSAWKQQDYQIMVNEHAGVYATSFLTRMQDTPLSAAYFYAMNVGRQWRIFGEGSARTHVWWAFKAFALQARCPERVRVERLDGPPSGRTGPAKWQYVLASKGEDGRASMLVSSYRTPKGRIAVEIRGDYRPTRVRILDFESKLSDDERWTYADGRLTLNKLHAGSTAYLVELERER